MQWAEMILEFAKSYWYDSYSLVAGFKPGLDVFP